ncbi:SNF2-related protein [Arcanobacterium hippocoleae]
MNLTAAEFADLPKIISKLDLLAAELAEYRNHCVQLATELRRELASQTLQKTDLDKLIPFSWQPLKIGVLKSAGITNVANLLSKNAKISSIAGIGEKTAQAVLGAAHALQRDVLAETPTRIDANNPSPKAEALLQALIVWEQVQAQLTAADRTALSFAAAIKPRVHQLSLGIDRVIVVGRARPAADFVKFISAARKLAKNFHGFKTGKNNLLDSPVQNVWQEFQSRAASFYAQMAEIGIPTSDSQRISGDLPEQVVSQVQNTKLSTSLLKVSLRGYQNFGARFITAQEKVILGDEMGLGKTLEALAVAADICEQSKAHIVVICPAAVVTNWIREIESKTTLPGYRLHGSAREMAAKTGFASAGLELPPMRVWAGLFRG